MQLHKVFMAGLLLLLPIPGLAYMGPALGFGVVGTVLAILAVILLALFSFVIAPFRRWLHRQREQRQSGESGD